MFFPFLHCLRQSENLVDPHFASENVIYGSKVVMSLNLPGLSSIVDK